MVITTTQIKNNESKLITLRQYTLITKARGIHLPCAEGSRQLFVVVEGLRWPQTQRFHLAVHVLFAGPPHGGTVGRLLRADSCRPVGGADVD